jgi:hypothetical protein
LGGGGGLFVFVLAAPSALQSDAVLVTVVSNMLWWGLPLFVLLRLSLLPLVVSLAVDPVLETLPITRKWSAW